MQANLTKIGINLALSAYPYYMAVNWSRRTIIETTTLRLMMRNAMALLPGEYSGQDKRLEHP
jgi:hypothetical protein